MGLADFYLKIKVLLMSITGGNCTQYYRLVLFAIFYFLENIEIQFLQTQGSLVGRISNKMENRGLQDV